MSLNINVDDVASVMIGGAWYDVADMSLSLDSYEFHWEGQTCHGGGESGICAQGFRFTTPDGADISGPFSSVQAVSDQPMSSRVNRRRKASK